MTFSKKKILTVTTIKTFYIRETNGLIIITELMESGFCDPIKRHVPVSYQFGVPPPPPPPPPPVVRLPLIASI